MRLLTFLSDFGSGSPYPAAMKAVAAGLCDADLVDISHDVPPGSIREAAYLLWSVAPACAPGTVHCAVVDPGVGTTRAALAVASGAQIFVGPDNGLLLPAARRLGTPAIYHLRDSEVWRHPVSATFHGRDVFAPTAARLAAGAVLAAVGAPSAEYVDFQLPVGRRDGSALVGEVLWIDRFGNLVTSIPGSLLETVPRGHVAIQAASSAFGAAVAGTFADVPAGELAVLVGSDGLVEVARNGGSAAAAFSATLGMALRLRPA